MPMVFDELKPYQRIEEIARSLQWDGQEFMAATLLGAHEGIFNGTELYVAWRHVIEKVLSLDISDDTRKKALEFKEHLDAALK